MKEPPDLIRKLKLRDSLRDGARRLGELPRLGREVFTRGNVCGLFGHRWTHKAKVKHLRAAGMSWSQLAAPKYRICARCGAEPLEET